MNLPNLIPRDHTYTSPTPDTRDTTMPNQNNTHNSHPQKTRRLDTTSDSGALHGAAHTQPTTPMVKRMHQTHPAPGTQPMNNYMLSEIMSEHHKHIIKAHMHYNGLQGPTTVGYPCTKTYMDILLAAHDPLTYTRSEKITEKHNAKMGESRIERPLCQFTA